jgi:hypothetical protein
MTKQTIGLTETTTSTTTTTTQLTEENLSSPHHKKRRLEDRPTTATVLSEKRFPTVPLYLRGTAGLATSKSKSVPELDSTSERHLTPDPILVTAVQAVLTRRNLSQQSIAQQIGEK